MTMYQATLNGYMVDFEKFKENFLRRKRELEPAIKATRKQLEVSREVYDIQFTI